MICPPGKSISFHKKETKKIELVARPGNDQHDSQEFLQYALEGLHSELNRVAKKTSNSNQNCDQNEVHADRFIGNALYKQPLSISRIFCNILTCNNSGEIKEVISPNNYLNAGEI